jgi:hypothetical protein
MLVSKFIYKSLKNKNVDIEKSHPKNNFGIDMKLSIDPASYNENLSLILLVDKAVLLPLIALAFVNE